MRGGLRARLTLFTLLGAAATIAALTIGFNLALRASLDADANNVLKARAQATLQGLDIEGSKITVGETADDNVPDARAWVFAGGKTLESPPATRELDLLTRSLSAGGRSMAEDSSTDTRLYAVPILQDEKRIGAVVSGISVEPYERSARRALVGSLIFSIVVLGLIALSSRIVISRALRPVARMTAEARDWSERDLNHRFNAGDPHDELTRLAATFDRMLDRLAGALRHEQRFSAELSHELRTPLAAIVTESELALRRERTDSQYRDALQRISDRSNQLQQVLETLLLAAREEIEPGVGGDAGEAMRRSVESFSALATEHGVVLGTGTPGHPILVDTGPATVERILSPLIENACLYGRARATVVLAADDERVARITVSDDGPEIEPNEKELIFEPGRRGSARVAPEHAGTATSTGTGLGLSLARRLARAVGGDVRATSNSGEAKFEVTLRRLEPR